MAMRRTINAAAACRALRRWAGARAVLTHARAASTASTAAAGQRAVVSALSEDPLAGVRDNVRVEPMAFPDTAQLGPNDVVVAVRSAAVHWVDLLMLAGQYQQAPPLPYTPGMEYAGEIAWAGADARAAGRNEGDAVFADIFNTGPRSYGKYAASGGCATWAVAPAEALHAAPPGFSLDQAATFCGAYETAHHALGPLCADVRAGETVLVHGATGATGLAAVQIASALGAHCVVTGGSGDKLDVVRAVGCRGAGAVLGAHDYRAAAAAEAEAGARPGTALREAVKAAAPDGVDVVYDTVGGAALSETSLRCLKFGGRYAVVGWTATPFAGGGRGAGAAQASANVLPTNLIMMNSARVMGCPVAIHTRRDPSIRAPRVAALNALAADGLLAPHVSHAFDGLDRLPEALEAKWGRQVVGACVVHPA